MTDPAELKRRKMIELMSASLGPAPVSDPDRPPVPGTQEYGQAMSRANPTQPETLNLDTARSLKGHVSEYNGVPLSDISEGTETRPWRAGYGAKGLVGVDRDILKRKVMDEAPPESPIQDRGDTIGYGTVQPAHKSTLRRIGEGILTGLASGAGHEPNEILGMAIGGGTASGVNPREGAEIERRFEMGKLDNDIARGLKMEGSQAELSGMKALESQRQAAPEIAKKKFEAEAAHQLAMEQIERDKAAGLITQKEAEQREREATRKERERHNRETEKIQREGIARPRVGADGPDPSVIDSVVGQMQAEQAKIDEGLAATEEALRNTPAQVNGFDNPEYATLTRRQADGLKRRQELDDQIRANTLKKRTGSLNGTGGAVNTELMPKGNATHMSRKMFVEDNPQFKGKSQREIDAAIKSGGFTPIP